MRMSLASGRRALARLPFLLLAACGLWLVGQSAVIPLKAWAAQILLERAFARSVAEQRPVRPWPWADAAPVARIRVPRLGQEAIVLSGGSGEAMAFGPTLLPASGRLGERGTAVFAAHRDTHFRFLGNVRPGDVIFIEEVSGRTTRYRAGAGRVVRYDAFGIDRHASRPSIALVTCWPIGGTERGPWRYVVRAELEGAQLSRAGPRPSPGQRIF
jgi:sortase A